MAQISLGLKHYLLILIASLVDDLRSYGLKKAIGEPLLKKHDVEKAFFVARAIKRRLPADPEQAEPDLWREIVKAVQVIRGVLDVLEKGAFDAVAKEARQKTSEVARADIKQAFEQRRSEGKVDFRLYGLSTTTAKADEPDPVARESSLMKRSGRYQALTAYSEQCLKEEEQVILHDAKALARRLIEHDLEDGRIDALLALATVLMELASVRVNTSVPATIRDKFDRMTRKAAMALGSIVYREEYQQLQTVLTSRV